MDDNQNQNASLQMRCLLEPWNSRRLVGKSINAEAGKGRASGNVSPPAVAPNKRFWISSSEAPPTLHGLGNLWRTNRMELSLGLNSALAHRQIYSKIPQKFSPVKQTIFQFRNFRFQVVCMWGGCSEGVCFHSDPTCVVFASFLQKYHQN